MAALAHVSVRVTERALLESIITLPAALRDWMSALAQVAAVLLPVAFIAALASGKRFSLAARAVLSLRWPGPLPACSYPTCSSPRPTPLRGAS